MGFKRSLSIFLSFFPWYFSDSKRSLYESKKLENIKKCIPGVKNMESPKSIAFNGEASLSSANKKFSGFRSLCITPCSWHICKRIPHQNIVLMFENVNEINKFSMNLCSSLSRDLYRSLESLRACLVTVFCLPFNNHFILGNRSLPKSQSTNIDCLFLYVLVCYFITIFPRKRCKHDR